MSSLDHFNFPFNKFTRSIPSLRAFLQGSHNAFEGNLGLCGPLTTKNCSDVEVARKKRKMDSITMARITIACFGSITIFNLCIDVRDKKYQG